MQANGIARQATGFGDHVPDIRIVRASFEQAFKCFFRIGRAILLEQQVDTHLVERVVAWVLGQRPVYPLLGVGQVIVGHVLVDHRQVVGDVVWRFGQQGLQAFPCFLEAAALGQGNGQAVTGGIILGVFIKACAKTLGGKARCFFV
ncbi:hypothetical protein D3C80_1740680 [compost metagenome]